MARVRRPIYPSDFTAIPRIREVIRTLPEAIRVCQEHGEPVTIEEEEPLLNQGGGVPFGGVNWVGCCNEAIDRVIEGVRKQLELIDRAKQTYTNKLAAKLEPEHNGEFVAIELETGDYFVGEDEVEAADKARAAGHDGSLWFLRVGSTFAHRLLTPRS